MIGNEARANDGNRIPYTRGAHVTTSHRCNVKALAQSLAGSSASRKLLLSLFIVSAGCEGKETDSRFVTRDSAGITIVESTSPAWAEGEGWVVDPSPVIDLAETGDGPMHEFFRATDAARLSDGSFVVADDGDDEIRMFSPTGVHLRTLGRSGDGPGEFQRLDQVFVLPGDSIVGYDFWQARITIFTPDGDVARIVTLDGAYRPRPLRPLTNGGYVGKSTDFTGFGDQPGLHRMLSPIVRVGQDGMVMDTLTTIPGSESVVFSRGDAWAIWGKDSHLTVHRDQVYLGSADSMEYQIRSPDGTAERLVRVPG